MSKAFNMILRTMVFSRFPSHVHIGFRQFNTTSLKGELSQGILNVRTENGVTTPLLSYK